MPAYTVEDIKKALDEVNRGVSIAATAGKYGIPRTTLSGKHHKVYPIEIKKGPATILTEEEELQLKNWIFHLGDFGFPITPDQLLDSVQHLVKELKRETPFTDGRPGRKWYKAFMRRHPDIHKKLSRNLSNPRTQVTQENILSWFKEVHEYLEKENLLDVLSDPSRVFNTDETAFFLSPQGDQVLIRRGTKNAYNFTNNDDKECLTALIGGNAAGKLMPTMVVYPYQRVPAVISKLFPKTWAIGRSDSGWMTSETFYEYIANIFHPWLIKENIKLPVILFVDGHVSHGTLHLSEFCRKNKIVLIALYPNSTHFMQPMDVSCFHPMKVGWKTEVRKWRFDHEGVKLRKENFAPLLEQVVNDVLKPDTLINGFRKCGLYPFTSEAINFDEMMVKSVNKDLTSNSQAIVHNAHDQNDVNYKLMVSWIEKALPVAQIDQFRASGQQWIGGIEDKSLFYFWRKHVDLISSDGAIANIRTVDNDQSIGRSNYIEHEASDSNGLCNIEMIELEGMECVQIEDIIIVDNSPEIQIQSIATKSTVSEQYGCEYYLSSSSTVNNTVVRAITDISHVNTTIHDNDSTSGSDAEADIDEFNDHAQDNYAFNDECPAKDVSEDFNNNEQDISTKIDDSTDDMDDVNTVEQDETKREATENIASGSNIDTKQHGGIDSANSYITLNTPPAFARALFYPSERLLPGKKSKSTKRRKQKIPSVYSSTEYSDYLQQKLKEKEDIEKEKLEKRMKREQAKEKKEIEKKEKAEQRIAKKEAMEVKKAELVVKKANVATQKATKKATKEADMVAKKELSDTAKNENYGIVPGNMKKPDPGIIENGTVTKKIKKRKTVSCLNENLLPSKVNKISPIVGGQ